MILLLAMICLFTACNKSGEKVNNENKNESESIENKNESENIESENTPEKAGEEAGNSAYPPMVKVDGITYVDTSYENAMATCGTSDGKIKTSVDGTKMPTNDDESNFGKGYGYQVWEDGYINVEIDNRWVLFRDIKLEDKNDQIPEWVAHFTGKVINTEEDSLLVEKIEMDDRFIFKDSLTKPILLSIQNLDNEKDGVISTDGLEGKTVEVYFGGEIKNTDPLLSSPISLEKIYRISVK